MYSLISDPLPPYTMLIGDKFVVMEEHVEEDKEIPDDERTAKLMTKLGNGIFEFIRLTCDYPSAHPTGYMPLLDIQTRAEDGKVSYIFFKKGVSNPLLLRANSAMPLKMKRTALIQERLRRLLRTRRQIPWQTKARIMSEFSHKMMLSGYWEIFRLEVIEAAVRLYDLKCQKADEGIEPLHRLRSFKRAERRKKKLLTPYVWHKPHDAPLFVPATPGSVLQSRVQEVADKHLGRMGKKLLRLRAGSLGACWLTST